MKVRGFGLVALGGLALLTLVFVTPYPASAAPKPPAGVFTSVYSFCQQDGCTDGEYPSSGVVATGAGTMFGTTCFGGADGQGTVFSITKKGAETVRASFDGDNGFCPDDVTLLQESATEFFGTAIEGGNDDCGTVFKLSQNGSGKWVMTILYVFSPDGGDACYPAGSLIKDAKGNLYGVSYFGGVNDNGDCQTNGEYGCGAVYELSPPKKAGGAWTEKVLYSFCGQDNCADGDYPNGTLVIDKSGTLYGATYRGGSGDLGTRFAIPPYGGEAVLYNFCSQDDCADGSYPTGGLVRDSAGNIFGTTFGGGTGFYEAEDGIFGGTVFKFTPQGRYSVLYSFCSAGGAACTDGFYPWGSLVLDKAGNLYGTAADGAFTDYSECEAYGCGTVFEILHQSSEAVLHTFTGPDGASPAGGLTMDAKGNLYGATYYGGSEDSGTVFMIKP